MNASQAQVRVRDITKYGFIDDGEYKIDQELTSYWPASDPSCPHWLITKPGLNGAVQIGLRPLRADVRAAGINKFYYEIKNTPELHDFMKVFHKLGEHCPACKRRFGVQV